MLRKLRGRKRSPRHKRTKSCANVLLFQPEHHCKPLPAGNGSRSGSLVRMVQRQRKRRQNTKELLKRSCQTWGLAQTSFSVRSVPKIFANGAIVAARLAFLSPPATKLSNCSRALLVVP